MSRAVLQQPTPLAASQSATPAEGDEIISLETDPRWQAAQRIAAGPQFSRSPLMAKFLLYVVAETLEGRQSGITEHQIGVRVFGRPQTYRTDEDNIVRNYARQLRKRLAEHFAGEGSQDSMRLDIPVGGYVPVFTNAAEPALPSDAEASFGSRFGEMPLESPQPMPSLESEEDSPQPSPGNASFPIHANSIRARAFSKIALALAYSAVLICLTWLIATRVPTAAPNVEPSHMLWKALLSGGNNTYVVPPDAGLNLLEDMSHRNLPLADYIKGSYLDLPLNALDDHTRQDLRTQQFSNFQSLQIIAALAGRQEYDPQRVFLRFPRDLRLDDLKTANAILIGSASSNPWASIADNTTNFRIVLKEGMAGANIVNARPMTGEATSYASHWNEPSHETFALIAFVPNLGGNGHILLLEGLDAAGTQAAAELLFHPEKISPILNRARLPDGNLRPFEILLRTTSIESNSAGTQVVASRIHEG